VHRARQFEINAALDLARIFSNVPFQARSDTSATRRQINAGSIGTSGSFSRRSSSSSVLAKSSLVNIAPQLKKLRHKMPNQPKSRGRHEQHNSQLPPTVSHRRLGDHSTPTAQLSRPTNVHVPRFPEHKGFRVAARCLRARPLPPC
jgi:hypothetical protein